MISSSEITPKLFITIVSFIALSILIGIAASQYQSGMLIWVVIGMAVFVAAFMNSEIGLYILVFSMLLSPEFSVGSASGSQQAAMRGGVSLRLDDFLLLIIGFSWFAKAAVNKDIGLFIKTPLNRPIFYYLIICIISTGFGVMAGRADLKTGFFFVLKYFEYFIVFFMMANHIHTRDQVNRFLICLFLTCFIVSIYGIMQIPGGGRVSAPFEGEMGEPNTLGGYFVFLGAIAMGLFASAEKLKIKGLFALVIACMIPSLIFTQSRSSYLAAFCMCLSFALMSVRRWLMVCIIIGGLIVSPFLVPSTVRDRVMFTFKQREHIGRHVMVGGARLDTSASARIFTWIHVAQDFPKHPILGYGVTGYKFVDAQFPKILIETGVLGLIAFFYLLYSMFKMAVDASSQLHTPLDKGLVKGFAAGLIGLLVHAIAANTFIIVRIMEPFWFIAAIVFVLPGLEAQEYYETAEDQPIGQPIQ